MDCCLEQAAPISLSPFVLALNPFRPQVEVPIGLLSPSALSLLVWAILTFLLPLPWPLWVVPTGPLDRPCFMAVCWVHTEEGNGDFLG